MNCLLIEAFKLFLKCIWKLLAVILDISKKSPEAKFWAVTLTVGKCWLRFPSADVPTKNGEVNGTVVTPADEVIVWPVPWSILFSNFAEYFN